MSDSETPKDHLPVVTFLKIPDQGAPYLEGARCSKCEAVYLKHQAHCARCFDRNALQPYRLGDTGTLYTFSIVRRSFPGIAVPFVSAYVELDSGGFLNGNLINVDPTPEEVRFGMRVRVVFADALGRKDKEGNHYLSYFFEPAHAPDTH